MSEPRVDIILEAHYLIAPSVLEYAAFDVLRWTRRDLWKKVRSYPQYVALLAGVRRRAHVLGSVWQIEDTDWGKRVSLVVYDAGSDLDDEYFPYRDPGFLSIANRDLGDEAD